MNDKVFGKTYADQYDLLYTDKDYEAECDLIEKVFQRYAQDPIETILDLGCGTGNHAIPLAKRDYKVTGVDRSSKMLSHAHHKLVTDQEHSRLNWFLIATSELVRLPSRRSLNTSRFFIIIRENFVIFLRLPLSNGFMNNNRQPPKSLSTIDDRPQIPCPADERNVLIAVEHRN